MTTLFRPKISSLLYGAQRLLLERMLGLASVPVSEIRFLDERRQDGQTAGMLGAVSGLQSVLLSVPVSEIRFLDERRQDDQTA